jgi:hypothetical protein
VLPSSCAIRGQPGIGTLDFARILGDIKNAGFDGYFCREFAPQDDAMRAIAQAKKVQI